MPDWRCLALPLADSRKRFFVPLWVFCLGMIQPTCFYSMLTLPLRSVDGSVETSHFRICRESRKGLLSRERKYLWEKWFESFGPANYV